MVELDQAAETEGEMTDDLELLEELQVVDLPRAQGGLLLAAVVTAVAAGVALVTVAAIGLASVLDVAGILARQ